MPNHRTARVDEKYVERIRRNWQRMRRLGPFRFILAFGTAMLLVMAASFAAYAYLHGTGRLLHERFVYESSLPCMAVVAYAVAAMYFWFVKTSVRRLLPDGA